VRHPDLLIVGAGPIGLMLGLAVARSGVAVTILEAGPATPPLDFAARNAGPNTGVAHQGLTMGRMKALGGTSRLWGGQLVPFGTSDFLPTFDGKPEWPIGHDDVAPYVRKAFDFLGIPETATDPQAIWRAVGQPPIDLGESFTATMNLWLPQPDIAALFAGRIAQLPNLRILTETEVTRLDFAPDGTVATVEARGVHAGRYQPVQTVLANGTLEIVRLLLRAAASAPHCPFAANPHIGRGFIDHLHGIVGRIVAPDKARLRAMFENIYRNGIKYSVKLRASDHFLRDHRLGNCAITLNATGSIRQTLADLRDLAQRIFGAREWRQIGKAVREAARTLRLILPIAWNFAVRRRSYSLFDRGILLGVELEQIPTAECRLFLDPAVAPDVATIGVHWAFDGREIDSAAAFCAELRVRFHENGLGTVEIDPRVERRDPAFLREMHDAYHQMGGARMAATADQGVVDRDLRVFGCANLSVAGAAVYPSGSFANPTLTAMALALRLADRLELELRTKPC